MHRLLYISTARRMFDADEVQALLKLSRRNNAAVGVTGLLIVGGKRFLQALEGPEPAVIATYDRIRRDPRHFAVVLLAAGPIAARAFPDWSMGLRDGGEGRTGSLPAIADLIAPINDPAVRGYFAGFAELRAAA